MNKMIFKYFSKFSSSSAILGGGLSGLSACYHFLKKFPSRNLILYEQSSKLGGALTSIQIPDSNLNFELGPSSIRKSRQLNELMKIIMEIGMVDEIVPAHTYPKIFIYYDGKLRTMPRSYNPLILAQFLIDNRKFVLSFLKFKYNKSYVPPPKSLDTSIGQILEGSVRFGKLEFPYSVPYVKKLAGALLHGIFASEPSEISFKLCWKKFHHHAFYKNYMKNEEYKNPENDVKIAIEKYIGKSDSFVFKKGLNDLSKRLSEYLLYKYKDNFKIVYGARIESIELSNEKIVLKTSSNSELCEHDVVISALPCPTLGNIIKNEKIATKLKDIKMKSLAKICLYYKNDVLPKKFNCFGILVSPSENKDFLGITFDSKSFPSEKNQTRVSVMIGDREVRERRGELEDIAHKAVKETLGIKEKPDYV